MVSLEETDDYDENFEVSERTSLLVPRPDARGQVSLDSKEQHFRYGSGNCCLSFEKKMDPVNYLALPLTGFIVKKIHQKHWLNK